MQRNMRSNTSATLHISSCNPHATLKPKTLNCASALLCCIPKPSPVFAHGPVNRTLWHPYRLSRSSLGAQVAQCGSYLQKLGPAVNCILNS